MSANILNVQRFCTKDGPGIRTTVFFKGCPMHCIWCHNPESHSAKKEMFFDVEKCVSCARCVSLCKNDCHKIIDGKHFYNRENCIACGNCLSPICDALSSVGKDFNADEIIEEVLQDKLYYQNSGGGLTLSGGEPLSNLFETLLLLKKAKENDLHTALETCGYAKQDSFEKVLPYVDLFLFDYKETNPDKHKEFTGVNNDVILNNLDYLDKQGKPVILRCPIIPTLNARDEHLLGIAKIANEKQNIIEVVIEPYHTLGVNKYAKLNKDYQLKDIAPFDDKACDDFINKLKKLTDKPVKKA